MSEFITNPEEVREFHPRYKFFYGAVFFTLFLFICRLWYLQIITGSELREFSEKNHLKENKIMAPRGIIFDHEGKVLIENHPGFEAIVSPQYIQDINKLAQVVAPILGTEPDKLIARIQKAKRVNGPFANIKLKENLSREEVFHLKKVRIDLPGLDIRDSVLRYYPLKQNGAQMLGYVGEISKKQIPLYNKLYEGLYKFDQGDVIGKSGIEQVVEKDIHGQDGVQFLQVDAYGRESFDKTPNLYGEEILDKEPVSGNNVYLTIDRDIQEAAYNAFVTQKRVGALIAMRTNGEILAWVNAPSFDPNVFSQGITPQIWNQLINDPNRPLRNKAIQDYYSPGSTFKAYMALAALQEKVVTPTTVINCPGQMSFGRRLYHDSEKGGHGNITIYQAIEESSNIFFYKMGIALGIDRMYNYISTLGIGSKTGVDLPQEVSGIMPSAAWKKKYTGEDWQPGENLSTAIGQGFVQASPIQMAVAYNAIALGGKVVKPFVIQRVVDANNKVISETKPKVVRDLTQTQSTGIHISPETFKVVREALKRVVMGDHGTGRGVRLPGIEIAGKTGTAQVIGSSADTVYNLCENKPYLQRHHGWFVGFAPADKPEIIVVALAEHSCHGASGGGPLVKEALRAYFDKFHPGMIQDKKALKKQPVIQAPPPSEDD